MAKIGIRLADGKFYPILEDGEAAKKRLVVTTVKDDQPSVQIDVYRSTGSVAADAYVGSLIIENIPPRPSGEPDIRLDLGLDDDGNLNAFAREEATGEHQALAVSLKSLAEEETYDIPDFDFQEDEALDLSTDTFPEVNPFDSDIPEAAESSDDVPDFGEEPPARAAKRTVVERTVVERTVVERTDRKRVSPLLIGLLAALATALILVAAYFIYTYTVNRQPEPPVAVQAPAPAKVEPVAPPPAPVATPPEPVAPPPEPAKVEAPAPVAKAPAAKPAPTKKAGTWYKIRWGDTLWDLSIAYYRTPWLYKTIAKANKIKNPDLIISATWIYIPPR